MECAKDISRALPVVFQVSLHQGTMPDDWKKSMVTSIFKKGDRSSASNYRPISLTSVCSKIMEHILYTQIMHHVAKFDILHDSHHGFRKKRSCETQLILTLQNLAASLDEGGQIDAIVESPCREPILYICPRHFRHTTR